MRIDARTVRADELVDEIARRDDNIASVATWTPPELPYFPAWVIGSVVVLGVLSVVRRQTKSLPGSDAADSTKNDANGMRLALIGTATLLYVLAMQFEVLSFVPATCQFVLVVAGYLVREVARLENTSLIKPIATIFVVAFLMSFAAHYLFTRILVVDLP